MSFIQVFTEAECAEIAARPGERHHFTDEADDEYVTRCKNIVRDFLVTKGIELNMSKASWKVRVNIKSHEKTKEWHHDDVTILNFVVTPCSSVNASSIGTIRFSCFKRSFSNDSSADFVTSGSSSHAYPILSSLPLIC